LQEFNIRFFPSCLSAAVVLIVCVAI